MRQTPYSRYPVYRGDESEVVGVVEVKSLLHGFAEGKPELFDPVQAVIRARDRARAGSAGRVPRRRNTIGAGGRRIRRHRRVVTLNDLLAAVVGASQIGHAGDAEDAPIVQREDGSWLVDGSLSTEDLRELLRSASCPARNEHEYRTAAGLVMAALGHIPQTGEVFAWHGIRFEVVDLDGARIDKLLVTPTPLREPSDDEQ